MFLAIQCYDFAMFRKAADNGRNRTLARLTPARYSVNACPESSGSEVEGSLSRKIVCVQSFVDTFHCLLPSSPA